MTAEEFVQAINEAYHECDDCDKCRIGEACRKAGDDIYCKVIMVMMRHLHVEEVPL